MVSLYWLEDAILGLLPTLWMILGLGLPWAYVILPIKQWQSRATVAAITLAIGPAWMTAWMLVLGVLGASIDQPLFTPILIIAGSIVIMLIGSGLAWRKHQQNPRKAPTSPPLTVDEKLIIGLITIAVIIRWIHTAFWSFTAYDALWVYGYQGRLYFLEGFIPHSIDYYPQFLQLQYAYVQVMIGAINDHAARMVIPMMHVGSILAAYLLGQKLFNRRIGLITAAFWSLHPYVGQWSTIGDLEIPVTFSFTMAAAFFLDAWMEKDDAHLRRRNALIAGIMLGIAMYTKPTAGAFIWGVILLVSIELIRTRFDLKQWRPRFMVAFWTGLASIPLGAVWYVRNILLGHDAITFPPELWLTLARRSGDHLNWIVLAVIVAFFAYGILRRMPLRPFIIGIAGIILLLIGVLPSNPLISPDRFDPPMSYITLTEAGFIIIGIMIIIGSLMPYIRTQFIVRPTHSIGTISWALLLALPYFMTWFYSYSYHYRLGFAIIPLMILPTAILLGKWFTDERLAQWSKWLRGGYYLLIIALSIPGIVAVTVDITWTRIWLLDDTLNSDIRKYQVFNPSIMEVYFGINEYIERTGQEPVILAPGEQRLHFFFPQYYIADELITELSDFDDLNPTHFLYGTQAEWAYERTGIDPTQTQIVSALGRSDLFKETKYHDDATFRYELYEYRETRFAPPTDDDYIYRDTDILFGDNIRLYAVTTTKDVRLFETKPIPISLVWQAIQPIEQDYQLIIEFATPRFLRNDYYWLPTSVPNRHSSYPTSRWETYEFIRQNHNLIIPEDTKYLDSSDAYRVRLYILDTHTNRFLPVYIDGEYAGNFFQLERTFRFGV